MSNNYDYKRLCPFKWFVLENFPFIEADFDALTNWQLFCKLGKEINKIIDSLNQMGIVVENISDYFDNLDVQEEINNKLDAMAEDGTLAEIINQEIFGELNEQVQANTAAIEKMGEFYVNVVGEGIANDGTDVSTDLQALINLYPNGATFYFPNGTYKFKDIELNSNTTILGDTDTNFVIDDDTICKQFIIDNKSNIKIENCNFRNGTTNEQNMIGGATANQKCSIFTNLSNNIEIKNCKFDIVSGCAFIYSISTEYVTIENCKFSNSEYAMILKISNCKHWYIDKNTFEDLYTGSTGNSYAIASGVLDFDTDTGFTEDIHITNNVFKNHIGWETIDSHGGRDYYVENNQFYECYQAIAIFDDQRPNRVFDMRNINIINNYIEVNGTLDDWKSNCITVRGNVTTGKMCKSVQVIGNKIISKNFNATSGLNLRHIDGLTCNNNYLYGNRFPVIRMVSVINGEINNNLFENTPNTSASARTRDFQFTNVYNITMQNNTAISPTPPNYALDIENNGYIKKYNENNFQFNTSLVRGFAGVYKYGKLGDLRINQTTNYINARASNKELQSTAASNVCTFKTTAGSNIVETSVDALSVISIGENITVVGAGANGTDIQAIFIEYIDNTHIKLDKQMYTTLDAAQVNTLDATWINLPVSAT